MEHYCADIILAKPAPFVKKTQEFNRFYRMFRTLAYSKAALHLFHKFSSVNKVIF